MYINDVYGSSVAAAQIAETKHLGIKHLVAVFPYHPELNFKTLVSHLKAAHPNVVWLPPTIPTPLLSAGNHPPEIARAAMIGTSSSFCMIQFARALGRGAIGLFAADKPDFSINPKALDPAARRLRTQAEQIYRRRFGGLMSGPAIAGFVAGWVLLHDVLPKAHSFTTSDIRQAALAVNLPEGSQINGGGVYFARPSAPDAGQNLRATSVIWQWQHVVKAKIVSPPDCDRHRQVRSPPDSIREVAGYCPRRHLLAWRA